jgi:RNA recognition motif-containing protein
MVHRVYVGNLPFSFTKSDLENMFQSFGVVKSTDIILDRETGRSRGFGFVELGTDAEAAAAVSAMDGHMLDGRALRVNEAQERGAGGGGGGFRGGGRGGGGGGFGGGGGDRRGGGGFGGERRGGGGHRGW